MDAEELAAIFESRAAGLRAAAESVSETQARLELLRIAKMYEEQAQALRARRR
jgi:hypothetical protein